MNRGIEQIFQIIEDTNFRKQVFVNLKKTRSKVIVRLAMPRQRSERMK